MIVTVPDLSMETNTLGLNVPIAASALPMPPNPEKGPVLATGAICRPTTKPVAAAPFRKSRRPGLLTFCIQLFMISPPQLL